MNNVPDIRFKGFEDEWSIVAFTNFAQISRGLTYSPSNLTTKGVRVLRSSNIIDGFFYIFENDVFVNDECVNIQFAQNNDILITAANGSTNLVGKHCLVNIASDEKMVPGGFMLIVKSSDSEYLHYSMFSDWFRQFLRVGTSGGNGSICNLNRAELEKILFFVAKDTRERKVLTRYFKLLDNYLQSTSKKIASLKQLKSASLISMFPQQGETVPRVRFKGFDGEWIEKSLGKIFNERVENDPFAEMLSVTINDGIIKASENGRFDNSNSNKSKYKLVKVGDIAYNSMRMWQGASGVSPYEGIVSPAYTVVTPNESVDSVFFSYLFKTYRMINEFRLYSQGLTKDTWNLKYPAFSKISVTYPSSEDEQRQIASYFRQLDIQISEQEKRLEKLKQIKAACLDKMFV